eukprot:1139502-Pelagomonas_calceolata.AAC.6
MVHSLVFKQLNKTITILRLTHNNIPDEGICALAEGLGARKHKTVTEIDVSGNKLQARGAKALANMLGQRGAILKCVGAHAVDAWFLGGAFWIDQKAVQPKS